MNDLEALAVIKDTKEVLEFANGKECIEAIEIAERALKDKLHIDIEYTDRDLLKQDILNVIKVRYPDRSITTGFVKTLFNEMIKDFDDKEI